MRNFYKYLSAVLLVVVVVMLAQMTIFAQEEIPCEPDWDEWFPVEVFSIPTRSPVCQMQNVWGLPYPFSAEVLTATGHRLINTKVENGEVIVEFGPVNAEGNWVDGEVAEFTYSEDQVAAFEIWPEYGDDFSWAGLKCIPLMTIEDVMEYMES